MNFFFFYLKKGNVLNVDFKKIFYLILIYWHVKEYDRSTVVRFVL